MMQVVENLIHPRVMDVTAYSHLCYPPSLLLCETVCRLLPVASCKMLLLQPKSSSIRAYATYRGGSPSSRKSVLGRAFKEGDFSTHMSSDSKSSSRERLITLFKRIQSEISQGESGSGDYSRIYQASTDGDSSVETSVLEFLQQSLKETKELLDSDGADFTQMKMRVRNWSIMKSPLTREK